MRISAVVVPEPLGAIHHWEWILLCWEAFIEKEVTLDRKVDMRATVAAFQSNSSYATNRLGWGSE